MQICRDAACYTQAERLRIAIDMLGEPAFTTRHLLWCQRGFSLLPAPSQLMPPMAISSWIKAIQQPIDTAT